MQVHHMYVLLHVTSKVSHVMCSRPHKVPNIS
jgi:hypothetical protein